MNACTYKYQNLSNNVLQYLEQRFSTMKGNKLTCEFTNI